MCTALVCFVGVIVFVLKGCYNFFGVGFMCVAEDVCLVDLFAVFTLLLRACCFAFVFGGICRCLVCCWDYLLCGCLRLMCR